MRLKIPLLMSPLQTLQRWAAEIRGVNFFLSTEFDWTDWQPTYTASGSMTFTSILTEVARYAILNDTCFFSARFNGTTGGVASSSIFFTLPFSAKVESPSDCFQCLLVDGGGNISGQAFVTNGATGGDLCEVRRYDSGNWGLGAGRVVLCSGFYRIN